MDCSEAESFYNVNEKLGSEEPIATDEASLSSGQELNSRPVGGVGSASILATQNEVDYPQSDVELVQYDATIPAYEDDYAEEFPILLADPFQTEESEAPLSLYGAPPL